MKKSLRFVWEFIVGAILLGTVSYWGNPDNFPPMSWSERLFGLPVAFVTLVGLPGWMLLYKERRNAH